jgi:hypothetical protein
MLERSHCSDGAMASGLAAACGRTVRPSHAPEKTCCRLAVGRGCNIAALPTASRQHLGLPVHGADARPLLEVEASHEPPPMILLVGPDARHQATPLEDAPQRVPARFMVAMRDTGTIEPHPESLRPRFVLLPPCRST